VIPIYDRGIGKYASSAINAPPTNLVSVQCVNANGVKQSFGAMDDGFLALGNTLNPDLPVHVVEGWGTAFGVMHHYQGKAVVLISFGESRLRKVAQIWAEDHPATREIVIHREAAK